MAAAPDRLVLYDGVCGMCNKTVQFLLDHDPGSKLIYAPLQGETAAALRLVHPEIPDELATIVYVEGGAAYLYSDAVLRLAKHLSAPWRWVAAFAWVPRPLRNLGYKLIASNRYRVFGKYDSCRIPSPDQIERFLP